MNYATGNGPQGIEIGDFNRDGELDLAIANSAGTKISILLGNGDGTFEPGVNYNAGNNPRDLTLNDFYGDGFLDMAVANG